MRGRRGLFSLFTSLPEHPEEKEPSLQERRRRRHSSGDRETWGRKVEYFFASLGYAVGLGNIWRFPYLCYRNGGGAFLIPYVISLIAVGFPILFLEMAFGQFASVGTVTIWRCCPLFKGIGYAILTVLLLVNTYYNVLIAYGLFYLFASITSKLPWASCGNEWNTKYCISSNFQPNFTINSTDANYTTTEVISKHLLKTPTEEYFERHLLNKSDRIQDLGELQWPLIVCLGVSWFTCFMCLFKGIKSMGKAVIFTTVFSYIILTVLLIRGVTLPGSRDGIIFYLKPDFKKLGNLQVWGEASAQAFASLSLGGGGWITLSSYNKFTNKCNRDTIMVGLGNALTSFLAGFVIFSVLGYMAFVKGVPVGTVTAKGPGLAFVAYPEGLALIPGAPFWAICFFFMMFTVGLDSLFGQVETIAAGIIDEYPDYLRPRRRLFTLLLCVFMFLLGIPIVTQGGIYIVTLMDWYTLLFSFSIISLFEIIVIIYIYGYNRFANDIFTMIGISPSLYYKVTWLVISPATLVCVIAFLFAYYEPADYGDYAFPPYAEKIGWCLALLPCALIPAVAVIQFFRIVGNFKDLKGLFTDSETRKEVMERLICPTVEWGPALPENKRRYSSSSSQRKNHPSGDTLGEDEVFGPEEGVELLSVKPHDADKVRFEDEKQNAQVSASAEKGQGEAKASEERKAEELKLAESKDAPSV